MMKKWFKEVKKKSTFCMIYIVNINNFKGKVKIKFVFTFYFMRFWPVQLELQYIEVLCFWKIFHEFLTWKMEVWKLSSQIFVFLKVHAIFPSSRFFLLFSGRLMREWTVEYSCLKPDCKEQIRLLSEKNL